MTVYVKDLGGRVTPFEQFQVPTVGLHREVVLGPVSTAPKCVGTGAVAAGKTTGEAIAVGRLGQAVCLLRDGPVPHQLPPTVVTRRCGRLYCCGPRGKARW
jgi:hypothetical protein